MTDKKIDKLPNATAINELDEKMKQLKKFTTFQSQYRLSFDETLKALNSTQNIQDYSNMLFAMKVAAIPVLYCEENIAELQKQINTIIRGDFSLLTKYISPPQNSTPQPIH